MNWSFGASPLVILLAAALLAGSGAISFLNWRRSGQRRAIGLLEALRMLLIILLAITLLRPEVVQTIRSKEQPELAILVDDSGSMATKDLVTQSNLQSRSSWLSNQVAAKFWAPLEPATRVVVNPFDQSASATNPVGTDLNRALESPLQREQNLKAVLLLTDGDWNIGRSPISAAARYRELGIPIFTVAVGSETPLPDLELDAISPPSYGLFGEQITIPFLIKNRLTNEVKTTLVLNDGSKEETRRDVVIPAHGQLQDTMLWYPKTEGDLSVTLKIPVEPGEAVAENNEQKFRISIRNEKLQVLVVDSLPRWEYRYLRNALARDPGVEVHSILYHPGMSPGAGRNYLASFPNTKEAISQYDVIFLGDVGIGPGELSETDAELIKGLVEQQASGLVFMPGRRGRENSFANSPLKDLLPVVFNEEKPEGQSLLNEAVLTLTSSGKGHLLTRFETDENLNGRLWQALPGFFWSASVDKARPGSEVLAVHSSLRNSSGRMPLLVTRSAGTGKVLFMGTDSAWRWRRGVEDKYHYRFWSQVVRWMAHQRHLSGKEGIRLAYSPERPEPGSTVFLQATVLDSAGYPAEGGPVIGSIVSPSGRAEQLQFSMIEGGWGVFKSQFKPAETGPYKVALDAPKQERKLETELIVHQGRIEEIGKPVNRAILGEIAGFTGGRSAMIGGLNEIVQAISLAPEPKPLERRFRIWSSPWWGGAILLLLTIYWIGRKVAGVL